MSAHPRPPYLTDHPYSSLTVAQLRGLKTGDTFFETGTNVGHGIQAALDAGFARVVSIDADPRLYVIARKRFQHDARVLIHLGESWQMLRDRLTGRTRPATIYLDAHGGGSTPILDELAVIADTWQAPHRILIDDVRMFGSLEWGGVGKPEILAALGAISPRFQITFVDTPNAAGDLLVATPPPLPRDASSFQTR